MTEEGLPMSLPSIAILHYSASPVIGGVEAVIDAHVRLLVAAGYPVTVVAGRGAADALPAGCHFVEIAAMDTQHPAILAASAQLDAGTVPAEFAALTAQLRTALEPILAEFDIVMAHNVLFKHFNLPLTAALIELLDAGRSEPDPAKRKAIYQDVSRRMATQVHGMWAWFTPWAIVTAPNVHNIFGPPLPGPDASKPGEATTDDPTMQPSQGLATGHPLLGLWIEQ